MLLFSHSVISDSLHPHGLQHARLPFPSPSSGICSNSCPLNWWYHSTISSSVTPPCPPILSLSQHQSPFPWIDSLHQVAKVLELQPQSFQWIFRVDFLYDWLVWSPWFPRDSRESSPAPQFENISSSALNFPYGPTLTSIYDYWENQSFDYTDLCWQRAVCFLMLSRFVIAFLAWL